MGADYKRKIMAEFLGHDAFPGKNRVRPISSGVEAFLKKTNLDKKAVEASIVRDWPKIAGSFNASHSTPLEIKNGTLTVGVKNSVMRYELDRQKKLILDKITILLGENKIRKIIFKVGA